MKQACCYKLPLYRSCANTNPARLRLQHNGRFIASEADTPRLLSYLESCRSRIMVRSHLRTCQGPSQAHKPVSLTAYAPVRSRLTRVMPAHAGKPPPAGLKPPGQWCFIVILMLRLYPIWYFSLNRFASWMWSAGISHSTPDQSCCPLLQAAARRGQAAGLGRGDLF